MSTFTLSNKVDNKLVEVKSFQDPTFQFITQSN